MDQLLQHGLNALMLGGTYALLGIGLTLIFGIMAHDRLWKLWNTAPRFPLKRYVLILYIRAKDSKIGSMASLHPQRGGPPRPAGRWPS